MMHIPACTVRRVCLVERMTLPKMRATSKSSEIRFAELLAGPTVHPTFVRTYRVRSKISGKMAKCALGRTHGDVPRTQSCFSRRISAVVNDVVACHETLDTRGCWLCTTRDLTGPAACRCSLDSASFFAGVTLPDPAAAGEIRNVS